MKRPAPRTLAYLGLWIVFAVVIWWRRAPEVEVEIERNARPVEPFVIDLNRDPWDRLILIEGIGETLARRIVRARERRGGFSDLEEVMALPGIPDPPLERARPWLRLGAPQLQIAK